MPGQNWPVKTIPVCRKKHTGRFSPAAKIMRIVLTDKKKSEAEHPGRGGVYLPETVLFRVPKYFLTSGAS
jgi:hypothetical protein